MTRLKKNQFYFAVDEDGMAIFSKVKLKRDSLPTHGVYWMPVSPSINYMRTNINSSSMLKGALGKEMTHLDEPIIVEINVI